MPRGAQVLAAAALLAAGCSRWEGNTYYARRGDDVATYRFGLPGPDWRVVRDVENVQVAWVNPALAGLIELHAQCEEQGDSSLAQYTDHLRIDWTEWRVLEQREERMSGRDALRTVVDAELDGVPRRSEFLVFKKNGCLFDLRYSASPEGFARGHGDFEAVVSKFEFPIDT